jgi:RNA polymerase sigma-70 factor (ECF subfamily)
MEYRDEPSFKGWMIKVVVNEALLFLRERRRLQFDEQDVTTLQIADDEHLDVEQITPDELHQLISELSDGYRTVVNLYVFEGYSHRQIAKLLGIQEDSSSSQLYYAKKLLTRRIRELMNKKRKE